MKFSAKCLHGSQLKVVWNPIRHSLKFTREEPCLKASTPEHCPPRSSTEERPWT